MGKDSKVKNRRRKKHITPKFYIRINRQELHEPNHKQRTKRNHLNLGEANKTKHYIYESNPTTFLI